jgi:hypothetical protein
MQFADCASITTATSNEKVHPPRFDDWIILFSDGSEIVSLQEYGALPIITNEKKTYEITTPPTPPRCDAWIIQIVNGKDIRFEILPRSIPLLSLQEIGGLPFGSYYKDNRRLDPMLSLEDNEVRNEDLIVAKRSINVKVRGNFSNPYEQESIELVVPAQGDDIKLLLLAYYTELEYDSFVLKREDKFTHQLEVVADQDIEDGDVLVMTH